MTHSSDEEKVDATDESTGADPRRPSDNRPTDAAVLDWLTTHHGQEISQLELLSGGFWSAAYGYFTGAEELVLRISDTPDGFRSDELAMRYSSPLLPVPEVLHIGEGFGRWVAISRRHHGRFLEEIEPAEADTLGPTVTALLEALRAVPDTGVRATPWHDWLIDGITDRPGLHTSGWSAKVSAHPVVEQTFSMADQRIRSLLPACADLRQLVHSDLLHYNVLLNPCADAVSAVFSWKCSTWGDALYDLAWCTFWGRWHDGIGALNLWDRVAPTLSAADAVDAGERHHAYELHVGASHLGWYATLGDDDNLQWTARQLNELLEAGPR